MSRSVATVVVVLYFGLAAFAAITAKGASLRVREARQVRVLHRWQGTTRFFQHHPRLARTRIGRREMHKARIIVAWMENNIARTRRALHPPVVVGFPIDYCTAQILRREGGMNPHSYNPSSGAYGGPQALPGTKMASAGADWHDNIWTQLRWMVSYETQRYGSPCAAWAAWQRQGWY